jgi:hypothetical protein
MEQKKAEYKKELVAKLEKMEMRLAGTRAKYKRKLEKKLEKMERRLKKTKRRELVQRMNAARIE